MTAANQTYTQTAAAGRQAAETAKSIGEDVSDFASDVSRRAGEQLDRAQDVALDALDDLPGFLNVRIVAVEKPGRGAQIVPVERDFVRFAGALGKLVQAR